jgi:hypothetical protein
MVTARVLLRFTALLLLIIERRIEAFSTHAIMAEATAAES